MQVAILLTLCTLSHARIGCDIPPKDLLPPGVEVPSHVINPTPHELRLAQGTSAPPLPPAVDWRNVSGHSEVMNQLLPSPCGSCWAFGSTGALTDRIAIASDGLHFAISPQALLDCADPNEIRDKDSVPHAAGSCNGGSHHLAYAFASKIGLTSLSCLPYAGMDQSNWGELPCEERLCKSCDRFGTCRFVNASASPRPYLAVKVHEYGSLTGVDAMMAEIAARGPIACSMYAHSAGFESYTGGVITDTTRYPGTTHVVNVIGYGTTKGRGKDAQGGIDYWIVRNSFGQNWGELGHYRVERGKNIFNMESNDCSWATPDPDFITQLKARSGY